MDSVKDRNGMDLKQVEDIKKRWQEYSEESRLKRAVNLNWRQFYPSEEIQQYLEMSLIVCTGRDNLHKKDHEKKIFKTWMSMMV